MSCNMTNYIFISIIFLLIYSLVLLSIFNAKSLSSSTTLYKNIKDSINSHFSFYEDVLNSNYDLQKDEAKKILNCFIDLKINEIKSAVIRIIIVCLLIFIFYLFSCCISAIKDFDNPPNHIPDYKKNAESFLKCFNVILTFDIILILCEIIDLIYMINYRNKYINPYAELIYDKYFDNNFDTNSNRYLDEDYDEDFFSRKKTCKIFEFVFLIYFFIFFFVLIILAINVYKKFKYCCGCCSDDEQEQLEINSNRNPNQTNNNINRNQIINPQQYINVENHLNSENNYLNRRDNENELNLIINNTENNIEKNKENSEELIKKVLKICSEDTFNPEKYKLYEDEECTICLLKYQKDEKIIILPCMHIFHYDCMIDWLKKKTTCPLDNQNLETYL